MDDLDRLFRHLVNALAATDPSRLPSRFEVAELYQRILPYRTHKLALQFDSIEDYELAILRLLSGERGYAMVHPPDVQAQLRAEIESVNPHPGAFREYAAATVSLDRASVHRFLDDETGYLPPGMRPAEPTVEEPALEPEPPPEGPAAPPEASAPPPAAGPVFEAIGDAARRCPHCRGGLPPDRHAVYCPHCGHQLDTRTCGRCGEPIEKGWRFCLACGFAIGG